MSIRTTIIRKLVARYMVGWSEGPIEEQRARQEKRVRYIPLPADVQCQPTNADGVPVEWIAAPGADSGVMVYLHGGAYTIGSINTARELAARLARATNTRALAADYRLAPEHPHPAAIEDTLTVYHWLCREVDPSRIIIAGDSAGGGLTLATLVALRDAGEPLPAGAVCISPWTDLALTGDSIQSKATADPILDPDSLAMYARYYARDNELTAPLLSPLYADLQGLPSLLIQVGTEEILLDDTVRCADKAREAGVDVTLEVWNEMFHVFQMLPFFPETKKAVERIAAFVSQRLIVPTKI
ncbi:MAG: alpha/beta hydrolase [Anaerolineae bacterium]|nr:alpha/beta hydrolase [Anaerolineae bacterium]